MRISVHKFIAGGPTGRRRREFMDRSMDTKSTVDCSVIAVVTLLRTSPLQGFKHAAYGGVDMAESVVLLACPQGRTRFLRAACRPCPRGLDRRAAVVGACNGIHPLASSSFAPPVPHSVRASGIQVWGRYRRQ